MKKILVTLCALALSGAMVFAEVSVSGAVVSGTNFVSGDNVTKDIAGRHFDENGDKVYKFVDTKANAADEAAAKSTPWDDASRINMFGGLKAFGQLTASATSADGKFGGLSRIRAYSNWDNTGFQGRAYGFFQPIPMVKVQLGWLKDWADTNHEVGWGFHANDAGDNGIADNAYSMAPWTQGDVSGWNQAFGLQLKPIEALTVNLALNNIGSQDLLEKQIRNIFAQVSYNISGIGTANVSFQGSSDYLAMVTTSPTYGWKDEDNTPSTPDTWQQTNGGGSSPNAADINPNKLYINFLMSGIKNLGLNVGAMIPFAMTGGKDQGFTKDTTYQAPISLGFGGHYTINDMFTAKLRAYFNVAGKYDTGDKATTRELGTDIAFEVMPCVKLAFAEIRFPIGYMMTTKAKVDGEEVKASDTSEFWLGPYLVKDISGGQFYAGFRMRNKHLGYMEGTSEKYDDVMTWAIPIGISFAF